MDSTNFSKINLNDFKWLNEPQSWQLLNFFTILEVSTDDKTNFWQGTWYDFYPNTGHVFGIDIKNDFVFSASVEANFTTLYDQAGLMIYLDEKHWLKAGIEYNEGQPMIGSVLTKEVSDWATGIYPGNPRKFYIRMTRKGNVVCVKYSTNNINWTLLRLCTMPATETYFVGLMSCTPQRQGLSVKFSNVTLTVPGKDILHSN